MLTVAADRGLHWVPLRIAAGEVTDFRLKCQHWGTVWMFKIGKGGVLPPNCRICPNQCNATIAHD